MNLDELPDLRSVPPDLAVPPMLEGRPAPGRRVWQVLPGYTGTQVYHSLYLPTNWKEGYTYAVLVEYPGNGPYQNAMGDYCSGKVEDCHLGYGISGGKGFIWVSLPLISLDHQSNQLEWWGDVQASIVYCLKVVTDVCHHYGGDSSAVFLCGFSRGSIACNFIGLHDEQIAPLWRGFVCHSHYDGVRNWDYPEGERAAAAVRLARLGGRPQFVSHEGSIGETREYLAKAYPMGNFTFQPLPYRNHTDTWVLRDIPERQNLRNWMREILVEILN
jgi:hypothetical protein